MINDFWAAAAQNEKVVVEEKKDGKHTSKGSKIKIVNKQDDFDTTQYHNIAPQPQPTNITVTSGTTVQIESLQNNVHTVNIKDISDGASAVHMIDQQGTILKTQTVLPKLHTHTDNLTSIVMNSNVALAPNGIQYQEMSPNVIQQQPVIPKYQQALQQTIAVQQQQLEHNAETGKVTFPKHVFSQARFVGKKQQQDFTVTEQPRVQCEICQKSLKTKKMLWAHKVAVHFGGNFPCEICGKKCITGAELRRHKTSHSSERKFVCQYCGLAYKRWSHLYQHLRVHEEEKNFRCDVCHLNFKVQSELKDHCFAEHTSGEFVQCSVCKHKLQTPLAVYHHSMKHTGTRDFLCEICGSNFKRKQHLVTHMKTHLTEKKSADGSTEAYECQACDETFTLKMELKAHCDTAHPLYDNDTVYCKTCKKKLNLSHSVYLHGLRHCGSREFQCDDCNQLFKRKAHLLRHKLDRHPEEPKQRRKRSVQSESIICSLCRKSFKYRTALIKHMASQHGILPKTDGSSDYGIVYRKNVKKPHQCDTCYKRFKSVASLGKHKLNKHCMNLQYNETIPSNETHDVNMIKVEMGENIPATMVQPTSLHSDDPVVDIDGEVTRADSLILSPVNHQDTSQNRTLDHDTPTSVQTNRQNEILLTVETVDQDHRHHGDLHRQVITVDEETGQIYLLQTSMNNPDSLNDTRTVSVVEEKQDEDLGKVIAIESDGANTGNHVDPGQVISAQAGNNSGLDAYESQVVDAADIASIQQNSVQMNVAELGGQVSLGQVINQDGVSISSVPLESLHALSANQNIDFSQTNNEQIVILLSALSGQNMQQL